MSNRADNFNRADSATALGTPSDGGSAWVAQAGTWGIASNTGYSVTITIQSTAVLDSGSSNVDVVVTMPTVGNDIGVVARAADNSNYLLFAWTSGTGYRLFKNVAGTFTQLGSTVAGTHGAGDTIEIKADSANAITGYHNGSAIVGPVTESVGATNTKHGIRSHSDNSPRFDNFSITDISAASAVSMADAGAGTDAIGSTAQLPQSDPGSGLEYAGMVATLARTDSGAGTDSLVPVIFVRMTDAGGASDALKLGPVSIILTDAGAGAEASGLAASFRIADPGAGADALSPTVLATMADSGSGRDAYAVAAVSILLADSGAGDEASNLAGSFRLADSGAGAELLAAGLAVVVFDSGAGADSFAAAVAVAAVVVAMADSGSGFESPIVAIVLPTIPGGYDPTFILLGGIPGFVVAVPALIRDGNVYDAIYALLSASGQFSVVTTSKTAPQAAPPSDAGASCHLVQQGAASRQEPHYARELRIPRYDLEIYVRTAFEEDPYQVADRIEAAVRDILLSKSNRTLGGIVLTEYSALARTAIDFAGSPDVYVRLMGQAGYVADYDLGGFRDIT